ncbi:hypothetical protein DZF91_30060 [Actinomadura logoneensis]|uniref:Uncharacterized protein n=1 Tax=Actinomadura logoneensis TaxID=2293572 RepID=A0A372JD92_9ACTN|nr:hypothetical protein [Actinomadura logoneensis]RFU37975.1 hypothetical protein DZF91_30060 [Actinomadura logoneensis]
MTTYRRPLLGVLAAGFGAAAVIALGSGPALADEIPMGHHHGWHHYHHGWHHHHMFGHWGCPPGPIKDGGHCKMMHHRKWPSTR